MLKVTVMRVVLGKMNHLYIQAKLNDNWFSKTRSFTGRNGALYVYRLSFQSVSWMRRLFFLQFSTGAKQKVNKACISVQHWSNCIPQTNLITSSWLCKVASRDLIHRILTDKTQLSSWRAVDLQVILRSGGIKSYIDEQQEPHVFLMNKLFSKSNKMLYHWERLNSHW